MSATEPTTSSAMTTRQVAEAVGGELRGPDDLTITGLEEVGRAGPDQLTFIGSQNYVEKWKASAARAAVVDRKIEVGAGDGRALILVDHADLAIATLLERFAPPPVLPPLGVHPTAVIDPSAKIGADTRIGPYCVIGPDARIGDRCVLHSAVHVMAASSVGDDGTLWPGVVIRERCTVGDRCILHPNVTLGADGFGYRPAPDGRGMVKIPQIGTVAIGHDVEIGANTAIDRGKFSATVIGDGCKIDNLVQIGHNCRLGRAVAVSGSTGIAGSVTVGDGAIIGGMVAIKDHVTIGAGATLAGASQVMTDVPPGGTWAGSPARPFKEALREVAALRRLPDLMKDAKQLRREMGLEGGRGLPSAASRRP